MAQSMACYQILWWSSRVSFFTVLACSLIYALAYPRSDDNVSKFVNLLGVQLLLSFSGITSLRPTKDGKSLFVQQIVVGVVLVAVILLTLNQTFAIPRGIMRNFRLGSMLKTSVVVNKEGLAILKARGIVQPCSSDEDSSSCILTSSENPEYSVIKNIGVLSAVGETYLLRRHFKGENSAKRCKYNLPSGEVEDLGCEDFTIQSSVVVSR